MKNILFYTICTWCFWACSNAVQPPDWYNQYDYLSDWHNGRAIVLKGKQYGIIDSSGNLISPLNNWYFDDFDNGVITVHQKGLCGLMDVSNGQLIVPIAYHEISDFCNERAVLRKGAQYFIANKQGKIIPIPAELDIRFLLSQDFCEDSVLIFKNDFGYGLLDLNGRIILHRFPYEIINYDAGRILVNVPNEAPYEVDNRGMMDTLGNWLTKIVPTKPEVHSFDYLTKSFIKHGCWSFCENNQCVVVDKNGEVIVTVRGDQPLKILAPDRFAVHNTYSEWCLLDKNGQQVGSETFESIYAFTAGLALVKKNDLHGYVNPKGKLAINFQYPVAYSFDEEKGRAYVCSDKNGTNCWYINTHNQFVAKDAKAFVVAYISEKQGLKDSLGNWCITPGDYDYISMVSEAINPAAIVKSNEKYGLLNMKNEVLLPIKYDKIDCTHGLCTALKGSQLLVVNTKGETLFSQTIDTLKTTPEQMFLVVKEGKKGLIDMLGNEIVPCVYDKIGLEERIFLFDYAVRIEPVLKDGLWGFINENGELLIPNRYSSVEKSLGYDDVIILQNRDSTYIANKQGDILFSKKGVLRDVRKITGDIFVADAGFYNAYGMFDKNGKIIFPFEYNLIHDIDAPKSDVCLVFKDYWGLVDIKGNIVKPIHYTHHQSLGDTSVLLATNNRIEIINSYGVTTAQSTSFRYESRKNMSSRTGLFVVSKGNKYALVNTQLKAITAFVYDDIQQEGLSDFFVFKFRKGKRWGFLDKNGAEIVPAQFDNVGDVYDDFAAIKKGNKMGVLQKEKLHEAVSFKFDSVYMEYVPFAVYGIIDGTYHLLSKKGNATD